MKKIIITGATSFLGRNVINGLLKDDCLIYALCRPNSSSVEFLPENKKLNIVYGSLADMEAVLTDIKKPTFLSTLHGMALEDKGARMKLYRIKMQNMRLKLLKLQKS